MITPEQLTNYAPGDLIEYTMLPSFWKRLFRAGAERQVGYFMRVSDSEKSAKLCVARAEIFVPSGDLRPRESDVFYDGIKNIPLEIITSVRLVNSSQRQ